MHVSQKNGEMDSMTDNTQQSFSQVSSPARSEAVVEKHIHKPVLETNTLRTSAGTSLHKIRKIIKNSSVEYFCNECNTHYSQLNWVKEDHPGIDVKKFSVIDLRKEDIFS